MCSWYSPPRAQGFGSRVIGEVGSSSDQTRPQAGISALRETVVEWENTVLFRLDPEVILQLFQLLRILGRDIVRLAEVVGKVKKFPFIVIEVSRGPTCGYPGEASVTGGGDPAIFVERAVSEHLEVLDVARARRFGVVEAINHAHAFDGLLFHAIYLDRLGRWAASRMVGEMSMMW
jgi:hypothetical protein